MFPPLLYFAHPRNVYGTPLQAQLIATIHAAFPTYGLVNPDAPEHQAGYQEWKRRHGSGMGYFTVKVLPQCQSIVFLAFRDGKIGKGVATEIAWFLERGFSVWEITPESDGAIIQVLELDPARCLTVEETVARVGPIEDQLPY